MSQPAISFSASCFNDAEGNGSSHLYKNTAGFFHSWEQAQLWSKNVASDKMWLKIFLPLNICKTPVAIGAIGILSDARCAEVLPADAQEEILPNRE